MNSALKGAVYTVWIFICICMSLRVFLVAKKMKLLTKGGIRCISQVFPWHFYFMREHSLVELTEHDDSAANIIVHSMYTYMYCCIHSTYWCVPIMNGRRSGIREKSRKQALDSAWSMEMCRLTRDGTAEPVSRDQILRHERGQGIIYFPYSSTRIYVLCTMNAAVHMYCLTFVL